MVVSRWSKGRLPRFPKAPPANGPGLLFILVALVAVAVAGARLLGFGPGMDVETVQTRVAPPAAQNPAPSSNPSGQLQSPPGLSPAPGASSTASQARAAVIVYHAHGTENYGPAQAHAPQGRPGDVIQVGEAFSESLEARGLVAIHDTQVHDHPRWAEAFPRAAQAVGALLRQHEDVRAVIDIHRDAIAGNVGRDATTAVIGGRPVARILLVIGDQNNPYARENAAFAEALKAKMDALYPGLARGIRIQQSDYNGRLHPNSVQVFIGDQRYNTVDEAREAARLLAHVVAEVVREQGGV